MAKMETFNVLTKTDIRCLPMRSLNTLCVFDPLPTWPVKEFQDASLHRITSVINQSILYSRDR